MSMELILGLLALFGTAAIGTPVAYSIIVGVIVYLGVAGQDIAIAGETMVQIGENRELLAMAFQRLERRR